MGTYKFKQDHLCGTSCKWCKGQETKRKQKIAAAVERHWEAKDKMTGYAVYGFFLVALVAVVI